MKNQLKIIFLFFSLNIAYCQMPVTDVSAGSQLTSLNLEMKASVVKTGTQIKIATEQFNTYKETLNKLKKVAAVFQSAKVVSSIIDNFSDIQNNISLAESGIGRLNSKRKAIWMKSFYQVLSEIEVFSESSNMVINDNILEMSDSDRLSTLLDLYKYSNELKNKSASFNRRVQQL